MFLKLTLWGYGLQSPLKTILAQVKTIVISKVVFKTSLKYGDTTLMSKSVFNTSLIHADITLMSESVFKVASCIKKHYNIKINFPN